MVRVAKYRPKGGVTTEDVREGEHEAVIKDTDTVTLQRPKRIWDKKLKANVVELDESGNEVMEDHDLLKTHYEIADVEEKPVVSDLTSLSMNPGDKDGNMRSTLYKNAMVLDEVPQNGEDLETDNFIGRAVVVKIVGKRIGDTTWANVDGPIVRALDSRQRRL
jgi:hypothetical protein